MPDPILIAEGPRATIYGPVRFMEWQWVDSFRAGRIRLGSVEKYRTEYEDQQGGRNDPDEHLGSLYQSDQVTIRIGGQIIGGVSGPVRIRQNFDECSYVLCMTAVTDRDLNKAGGNFKLDKRLLGLGDAAVVVTDPGEFQHRLKVAIDKVPWLRAHPGSGGKASGLVEYVDFSKHHGDIGPFRKSVEFRYQHEWRLALIDVEKANQDDHLFLDVGDISDITIAVDGEMLVTDGFHVRLEPELPAQ